MTPPSSLQNARAARVVVAGGSIAGLGAGIALHRAGMDVQVFERDSGPLRSTGAGLVVQPELISLLNYGDGPPLPVTRCSGRRNLHFDGSFGPLQIMPQQFTSWDAVHQTMLRILPQERFHVGARVDRAEPTNNGLRVLLEGNGEIDADLLVAAEGAQSPTRRRFLPELEADYAGYIAWRGTLLERDMPPEIVAAFDDTFTFCDALSGGHALAYFIPGDDLKTGAGQRRMNWVWYVGATPRERDSLLVTRDGIQRQASLSRGMARDEVIADLAARAVAELHPMFAELVQATADPFLQTIVDFGISRTVFDRNVLIGDAAFVVRPHTAGGAAKAARDAQTLALALGSADTSLDDALQSFQRQQIAYGRELLLLGIRLGKRWSRL